MEDLFSLLLAGVPTPDLSERVRAALNLSREAVGLALPVENYATAIAEATTNELSYLLDIRDEMLATLELYHRASATVDGAKHRDMMIAFVSRSEAAIVRAKESV